MRVKTSKAIKQGWPLRYVLDRQGKNQESTTKKNQARAQRNRIGRADASRRDTEEAFNKGQHEITKRKLATVIIFVEDGQNHAGVRLTLQVIQEMSLHRWMPQQEKLECRMELKQMREAYAFRTSKKPIPRR
jgi:hypothetical protein